MNRTRTISPSTLSIWAAMLAVYVAWGSTYLAIRFSIQTIPPFLMAGIRFLIAGGVLYAYRRLKGDPAPTGRQWRSSGIVGLLLLLGGNGCVVWAEQRVVSGVAALMVASSPLWMILIDAVLRHGKPGARRPGWISILGVVLGFVGIAALVSPSELTGLHGQVDPLGAAVLTLAAFLWASGSIYSRGANLPSSPLLGTSMEMLCGGAALLAVGTVSGEWANFHPAAFSTQSLLGIGYLITIGSLIGYSAYTWLLRVAPTTLVSTYAYVNPIVAIFVGNLLASEPLTLRVVLATLVIVGAVVLITFTQPLSAKNAPVEAQPAAAGDD
ncbi:MAG TPA: EamA family transporter [Anaerolineaceae bacterium]|jgi:drug/metabolite transporter (DMT)-like permease